MILGPHDTVQPDLVVVADPAQVSDRGIEGAPLLVVEILSPPTREHDLGVKARRYAELGVGHYWIVDPEGRRIECRRGAGGRFRVVAAAEGEAVVEHPEWGVRVELGTLWGPAPV